MKSQLILIAVMCIMLFNGVCFAQDVPTWHRGDAWPLRRSMEISFDSDDVSLVLHMDAEYTMQMLSVEDRSDIIASAGDIYICRYTGGKAAVSGEGEVKSLSMNVTDLFFREGTGRFSGEAWIRRADLALVRIDMHTTGILSGTVGNGAPSHTGDLLYLDVRTSTTFSPPLEIIDFPLWFGEPDWITGLTIENTVSYDIHSRGLPFPLPDIREDTIRERGTGKEETGLSARISYVERSRVGSYDDCRRISILPVGNGSLFAEYWYHPDPEYFVRSEMSDVKTEKLMITDMIEELAGEPQLAPEPFFIAMEPKTIVSGGFGILHGWEGLGTVMFPTTQFPPRRAISPYNFLALFGSDDTLVEGEIGSHGVVVEKSEDEYNVATITVVKTLASMPGLIIGKVEAREGDRILLPVTVERTSHFSCFGCDIIYETGLITLSEVQRGDDITTWTSFSHEEKIEGIIHIEGSVPRDQCQEGDLQLSKLFFDTQPGKMGKALVTARNLEEGLWNAYVQDGEIHVRYLISREEILGQLMGRSEIPPIKLPDADQNGDNLLDISDVVLMILHGE